MRVAFIADPIDQFSVKKETTLALMAAAHALGWLIYLVDASEIYAKSDRVFAKARQVTAISEALLGIIEDSGVVWQDVVTLSDFLTLDDQSIDLAFMRKDPPLDASFWSLTYLLDIWEKAGVCVTNSTAAIKQYNEKCSILQFPSLITNTLISANVSEMHAFIAELETVIIKPLDSMGGHGIRKMSIHDSDLDTHLRQLTHEQAQWFMVQKVLPVEKTGDRRVLMFHGKPLPYVLARYPAEGNFLANLAAGGHGVVEPLSALDRKIAVEVAAKMPIDQFGLIGLDVIDGHLSEINVTSPTCLRELQTHSGENYALSYLQHFAN